MERREVIGGGLAGLTGLLGAGAAGAPQDADRARGDDTRIARAIDDLRDAVARQFDACEMGPCREISLIREQQRQFLRARLKYPDFIEVGLDVWERVHDWHVKHHQPIATTRLTDGRYVMTFMFTRLILRVEQAVDYVGFGFDGELPAAGRPAQAPVRQ